MRQLEKDSFLLSNKTSSVPFSKEFSGYKSESLVDEKANT